MATKTKKTETEKESIPSLTRKLAEINRKYGAGTIGTFKDKIIQDKVIKQRIPTGVASLDTALGLTNTDNPESGGFPMNSIVELYGIPSSGKSLITLLAIKNAQAAGLECVYIDAEGSFDPDFATKMGVDVNKLVVAKLSLGEDIFDIISDFLAAQPGIVVIDSVAAIITDTEMEASLKDQQMAIKARLMSKALAKINALNKKTLFLFINQVRDTMAMYGAKETTPGGRALGHYASIRMRVHQGDKLRVDGKKTGDIIGQVVQYNITKNKTAQPFKQGYFNFFYEGNRIEQ